MAADVPLSSSLNPMDGLSIPSEALTAASLEPVSLPMFSPKDTQAAILNGMDGGGRGRWVNIILLPLCKLGFNTALIFLTNKMLTK